MKNLHIYYHMVKGDEIKETIMTLFMEPEVAYDIIEKQARSIYVDPFAGNINISDSLNALAKTQGYESAQFILADHVYEPPGAHNCI